MTHSIAYTWPLGGKAASHRAESKNKKLQREPNKRTGRNGLGSHVTYGRRMRWCLFFAATETKQACRDHQSHAKIGRRARFHDIVAAADRTIPAHAHADEQSQHCWLHTFFVQVYLVAGLRVSSTTSKLQSGVSVLRGYCVHSKLQSGSTTGCVENTPLQLPHSGSCGDRYLQRLLFTESLGPWQSKGTPHLLKRM